MWSLFPSILLICFSLSFPCTTLVERKQNSNSFGKCSGQEILNLGNFLRTLQSPVSAKWIFYPRAVKGCNFSGEALGGKLLEFGSDSPLHVPKHRLRNSALFAFPCASQQSPFLPSLRTTVGADSWTVVTAGGGVQPQPS